MHRAWLVLVPCLGLLACGSGDEEKDRAAPSVPTELRVVATPPHRIDVTWTAAVDRVGVVGYVVFRNAAVVGEIAETAWVDDDLDVGTYCYAVAAFDRAGNESAPCSVVCVNLLEHQVLQNDGFLPGGNAHFQQGFVAGEAAAVTLGPLSRDASIVEVVFLFGGDPAERTVDVTVYAESGGAEPGAELGAVSTTLTGANDAMQVVDLAGEEIALGAGASFRVALGFSHVGLPSVARDDDGRTPARNWIYAGNVWADSGSVGVSGDWIIRAVVRYAD